MKTAPHAEVVSFTPPNGGGAGIIGGGKKRIPGASQRPLVMARGSLTMPPMSCTAAVHIANGGLAPGAAPSSATTDANTRKSRRIGRWKMHAIVAWTALGLGFLTLVMVAILYFNWSGGPLTAARDVIGVRSSLSGGLIQEIEQEVAFTLKGDPGKFMRWPDAGSIIKGLDMKRLTGTRLCCRIGGRYFVCDYGQGATENIGVECFVEYLAEEGGSHLLLNIQSDQMNGAECIFRWSEQPPVVGPIERKNT